MTLSGKAVFLFVAMVTVVIAIEVEAGKLGGNAALWLESNPAARGKRDLRAGNNPVWLGGDPGAYGKRDLRAGNTPIVWLGDDPAAYGKRDNLHEGKGPVWIGGNPGAYGKRDRVPGGGPPRIDPPPLVNGRGREGYQGIAIFFNFVYLNLLCFCVTLKTLCFLTLSNKNRLVTQGPYLILSKVNTCFFLHSCYRR